MASAAPAVPPLARDRAFEDLHRTYVRDVYHYALALLRNPTDAEDVTQTTFLNAYRAFRRGEEIQKPQNWLIKIAHNVARTRYARASRRVKEVTLEDHIEQLAVPEDERPDVEQVLRALGRLPFNQRAALIMRELEGRSYGEISETIGVSVPAVETLIFRARRSLRLRAAALRALAAVPVPTSLAQFFEGGLAGGGALVGTGFLVKAAVALLAGAVATGIARDHLGHPRAAPQPQAGIEAAPAWPGGLDLAVQRLRPYGRDVGRTARRIARQAPAKTERGAPVATPVSPSSQVQSAASTSSGTPSSSAPSGPSSATTATKAVTAPATSLVTTAQETATSTASSLPVSAPALPSPPVSVPPAPKLP